MLDWFIRDAGRGGRLLGVVWSCKARAGDEQEEISLGEIYKD